MHHFSPMFARKIVCQYWDIDIWLVSLNMRRSVATNLLFILKWRCNIPKGLF